MGAYKALKKTHQYWSITGLCSQYPSLWKLDLDHTHMTSAAHCLQHVVHPEYSWNQLARACPAQWHPATSQGLQYFPSVQLAMPLIVGLCSTHGRREAAKRHPVQTSNWHWMSWSHLISLQGHLKEKSESLQHLSWGKYRQWTELIGVRLFAMSGDVSWLHWRRIGRIDAASYIPGNPGIWVYLHHVQQKLPLMHHSEEPKQTMSRSHIKS